MLQSANTYPNWMFVVSETMIVKLNAERKNAV